MQANSIPVNPLLSNVAVDFKNEEYVAERILTPVQVPQMLCRYTEWDKGVTFKMPKAEMAQNGVANIIDVKGTPQALTLQTRALAAYIDELERSQAPQLQIEMMKTQKIKNQLDLDKELRVKTALLAALDATKDDLSGTDQWSDPDSDPVAQVAEWHASMATRGNKILIPEDVFNVVRVHPKILEALQFTASSGIASLEQLARLFEVDEVIVARAKVDTAGEGLAEDKELVWQESAGGGIVILAYVARTPPSPLMDQPTLGYIPTLGGGSPTTRIYKSVVPTVGTGGGVTHIKGETAYGILVSAPSMAVLGTSVLS